MVARALVWAVRLGLLDQPPAKGFLYLTADAVTFVPEKAAAEIEIPLSDVQRVRRSPASPVIVIERSASAFAFYFAEPPPLRLRSGSRKAKGRLKTMTYLSGRNRTKRAEVKAWADRIKRAAGGR